MAERRFDAMGTRGHVVVTGGDGDGEATLDAAQARIAELERRWSRFLPDSEVSRLNRSAGRPTVVSGDTAGLVARAVEAWRLTGGRFDPTVLPALVAAGYDRSFEALDRMGGPAPATTPSAVPGPSAIRIDEAAGLVHLPAGVAFDPGGIGKGYAADLVVAELLAEPGRGRVAGACVNLGGDLRAAARAPGGAPWVVDVEDPFDAGGAPLLRLGLDRGGVATSSRLRRTWTAAGTTRHHLIDPSTGAPAETDAVAATVLAGTAWRAEALATAAVLAGVAGGLGVIAGAGATGLVVDDRGGVHHAPGLGRFLDCLA